MSGRNLLTTVIGILLVVTLWKPLLWLAVIVLIAMGIFFGKVLVESTQVREEIARDPDAYFEKQKNGTVIDAEYTVTEVEEPDNE